MSHTIGFAMNIMFAGGGTGGHLAPGIAIAEELSRSADSFQCVFVGSGKPVEHQMLQVAGFDSRALSVTPLKNSLRHPIEFLIRNGKAVRTAIELVRSTHATVVIGLGGFASVPVVLAAALLNVPVLLLEQNAIPGRANRWLSHWFPICVTFESSIQWLPQKACVHLTGNPLRRDLLIAMADTPILPTHRPRQLLIMGGSQGSSSLNEHVLAVISQLAPRLSDWHIVHQTGANDVDRVRQQYQHLQLRADVQPFFSRVTELYAQSQWIICRAGATTLCEISLAGLPAILIPFPYSADQHQVENARSFTERSAALTVLQRDPQSTQRELYQAIASILDNPTQLDSMSTAMRRLCQMNASKLVIEQLRLAAKLKL